MRMQSNKICMPQKVSRFLVLFRIVKTHVWVCFFGSFRQFVPLFKVFQVNNLSIRQKVKKMYQCALDSAGLSISTLIMFTDDCRSFQAATGIREKTAHTRHHQKLETTLAFGISEVICYAKAKFRLNTSN